MKKVKLKILNMILMLLLVTFLGAGCGRQKVIELPVATENQTVQLPESETLQGQESSEYSPGQNDSISSDAEIQETQGTQEDNNTGTDVSVSDTESGEIDRDEINRDGIDRDGIYYERDDVAAYIHEYGELPSNFITKKEAKKLGWTGGSLEDYAPGKCIGGDRFGTYEGLLPEKKGRSYYECDIDTLGKKSRGPKRLIYSNDGLIFYTEDHYESFTQLY